ncbi:MAG: hypothetical protein RI924_694 [Bacteroidota bacterium]|jgi:two-component system phosphate regulon sensor histidine kinase PhoR
MKLSVLVFINALAVALSLALLNFYFQQNWLYMLATFVVALVTTFVVFYYLTERYVYSKIKLIYLKDALGEYVSADPINDVENEVKEWAINKKSEIDGLKKQEEFRREFLANISHEFKTPLFAIQGYIEALQEGVGDEKQSRKFLEKAAKNIDRLSYLIKDLDAISKLESGEVPINYEVFELSQLIHEVIDGMEMKVQKYRIKLTFKEKYDQPSKVYADREKIRQVLVNLIDNSFKYGKADGETSIKIFELHDQYLVEVTDDGVGIEEKNLNRIFERFYRTDFSRSREIGGSGLGLSIVKHILEAHSQTITVRSTENIGSTFAFTLQMAERTIPIN